jgi:hypothetical protein
MHKPLAEAILKTFHDATGQEHRAALASFPARVWTSNYLWLDASGLALYFLDRLRELNLQRAVPLQVRQRLEQNLADNRERSHDAFAELTRVHSALSEAGIEYVNVKGLTLFPHACKDPALRLQLDLDIVAYPDDAQRCQAILESLGYLLTSASGDVWEFTTPSTQLPSVGDLYKPKPQRSIEVHFRYGVGVDDIFETREWQKRDGQSLPVLSDVNAFLGQATHLLKHLHSEWIRLSWLLEFRHSVRYWADDREFWLRLHRTAAEDPELRTALGAAILLTTAAFGDFAPQSLKDWTVNTMDRRMRLWLDLYARDAIMADYPGTKLYLLQPPIFTARRSAVAERRLRLLPLHTPPMIVHPGRQSSLLDRLRAVVTQAKYITFRLRFHLAAGLQYRREAPRWRRHLAETQLS